MEKQDTHLPLLSATLVVAIFFATACGPPASEEPSPTATPTAQPTPTPSPAPTTITLAAVGDLMIARDLVTLMDSHGAIYPFEHMAPLLADADVTIANLEGTLTTRGTPASKKYVFRTPPRHAAGLAQAGIDVVSLANNHMLDFGPEGLRDTLAALDAAGIAYSGAGESDAAAQRPAILDVQGLQIAFLSYTTVADAVTAGPDRPGVAWGTVNVIRDDVRRAKEAADVVVVSLHAGVEYADEPSPTQIALAQAAAEAGAAVILGHHPHVLQRWEFHGPSLIAYSLGNFVFDLDADDLAQLGPAPFQTVILKIHVSANGVERAEPVPVYIDPWQNRPRPADPAEAQAILDRLRQLGAHMDAP